MRGRLRARSARPAPQAAGRCGGTGGGGRGSGAGGPYSARPAYPERLPQQPVLAPPLAPRAPLPGAAGAACSAGVGAGGCPCVGDVWWRLGCAALGTHVRGCLSLALLRPAKLRPHRSPSRCPFSNRCTPATFLPLPAAGHTLLSRFMPCQDAKGSGRSRSFRRTWGGSGRISPGLPLLRLGQRGQLDSRPWGARWAAAGLRRDAPGRGGAPRKELNLRSLSPRSARQRGGMLERCPAPERCLGPADGPPWERSPARRGAGEHLHSVEKQGARQGLG